mgnify:CR=1 FL=1
MVDFADSSFGGASFGGGYSDPGATGNQRSRDNYGSWGNYTLGPTDTNPNTVTVTADMIGPNVPGHGPQLTESIMGPMTGPGLEMEGALVGGGYNANNMGGGMPGGAPGGPAQNPGAGQMAGGMAGGPMSEGGGEPLIMRLQGLTPEQQNFLLNDPNALRAFNQEYNRILQSGQGGQVGVGWSNDDSYTHGQYNVNAANTGGLISQGSVYNDSGSAA